MRQTDPALKQVATAMPAEIPLTLPKRRAMAPVKWLSRAIIHADTYFEDGAEEEIIEHKENSGSTLLLATHFRRWEPLVIGQVAAKNKSLGHLWYNTGITIREELASLREPVGYIIRNSGGQFVKRSTEHQDETPEEKQKRQDDNQRAQAIGGRFLSQGLNWLIFPEGESREAVKVDGVPVLGPDGKPLRKPRKPGVLLPVRQGFVYTLESMTPEERARVKLLGIAVHYGDRKLPSLRPTVHVSRPVAPVEGSPEEIRQQGEDLLAHGLNEAMRLDALRISFLQRTLGTTK